MAETNPQVTNLSAAAPIKRTRSKKSPSPVWKLEIVDDDYDPDAGLWSELSGTLGPLVEAAGNALGDLYVSIAKVAFEWRERLEDRHAEQKARQRAAVRPAKPAKPANPVPEMRLIKGSGSKKRSRPAAKSHSSFSRSRGF
jgi:hypothetical protein